MAYGAWYGGLAGSFVIPSSVFIMYLLAFLTSNTEHILITVDGVLQIAVGLLAFGTSGVIAGCGFGFIYGLFLYLVERIFGLEYPETCRQNTFLGIFIFIISVFIAFWMFVESFRDDEAFALMLFIGWFCWTPLIPFLFLNRKLIHLFE